MSKKSKNWRGSILPVLLLLALPVLALAQVGINISVNTPPPVSSEARPVAVGKGNHHHPESQTRTIAAAPDAPVRAPPAWTPADVPTLLMTGATSDQVLLILKESARYMPEEPSAQEPARAAAK